jgi:MFS family permease
MPMIVAPIAVALADRYGNRVFMALGLALQGAGLAWVAAIATPTVGYAELGVALTIAGIGTSLTFPTVANAVMGSVPRSEAGVASGANNAIARVAGLLAIAVVLAAAVLRSRATTERAEQAEAEEEREREPAA